MPSSDWTAYWRSTRRPLEVMHAHFQRHAYDRHSHETYSFGVTEAGAQSFRCRGAEHTSTAGMVLALNPDEPHDGHAGADGGFTYKIVHIGPDLVADVLSDAAQRPVGLPLFAEPVIHDPALADALRGLDTALLHGDSALAQDEAVERTVHALARRAAANPVSPAHPIAVDSGVRRVRDLLEAHFADDLGVARLAEVAGRSRFALNRAFSAAYGLMPSEYQRQLRLRHARRLIAAGSTLAEAATAVGFADQSHLNRWFRRHYGITPGAFQRAAPLSAR
ncbi:AraC family transcriptional regulator [Saccharopolyspora taberi]|uniref:AraC family transcriptional regulator n=1 Tax=Saccharopolyspora taberi TaxID=60895 RepID=A0ABN3VDB0_9PSEU